MIFIKIEVVNPFLPENQWVISNFKSFGFDLNKDLKNVGMKRKEVEMILKDLSLDVSADNINGAKITSKNGISVYKMRYKDQKRNMGSSGAYRLISLILVSEKKAIPFHLYHKRSGKKPKTDLTASEYKKVNELVDDISNSREEV